MVKFSLFYIQWSIIQDNDFDEIMLFSKVGTLKQL